MTDNHRSQPLILIGAGGHAKVLLGLIQSAGLHLLGVCAPELVEQGVDIWRGVPVLGAGKDLSIYSPAQVCLVNGVGRRIGDTSRQCVFDQFKAQGYFFPALIHPSTYVDTSAILKEGAQVMAGAVIQADASIGENVIVNTSANVDHDCVVEAHVHIAPGAILCGNVRVCAGAFIAAGATLTQGVSIGKNVVVGAGATIVRDLFEQQVVLSAAIRHVKPSELLELDSKNG
ncbi:MAG: acetyltransferase [Legionellaceae bacterium]|nr:acetyltransferase [Legionellaceae bacterium]